MAVVADLAYWIHFLHEGEIAFSVSLSCHATDASGRWYGIMNTQPPILDDSSIYAGYRDVRVAQRTPRCRAKWSASLIGPNVCGRDNAFQGNRRSVGPTEPSGFATEAILFTTRL